MTQITHNGVTFSGNEIRISKGVLYVDGHAVQDMTSDSDKIYLKGESGNLICDKGIVINENFVGNIQAEYVVINGEHTGTINAQKVIDNR